MSRCTWMRRTCNPLPSAFNLFFFLFVFFAYSNLVVISLRLSRGNNDETSPFSGANGMAKCRCSGTRGGSSPCKDTSQEHPCPLLDGFLVQAFLPGKEGLAPTHPSSPEVAEPLAIHQHSVPPGNHGLLCFAFLLCASETRALEHTDLEYDLACVGRYSSVCIPRPFISEISLPCKLRQAPSLVLGPFLTSPHWGAIFAPGPGPDRFLRWKTHRHESPATMLHVAENDAKNQRSGKWDGGGGFPFSFPLVLLGCCGTILVLSTSYLRVAALASVPGGVICFSMFCTTTFTSPAAGSQKICRLDKYIYCTTGR